MGKRRAKWITSSPRSGRMESPRISARRSVSVPVREVNRGVRFWACESSLRRLEVHPPFHGATSCFLAALRRICALREVRLVSRAPRPRQNGPVAQWLEQGTHNPLVVGSNPTGPTLRARRFTGRRGSRRGARGLRGVHPGGLSGWERRVLRARRGLREGVVHRRAVRPGSRIPRRVCAGCRVR